MSDCRASSGIGVNARFRLGAVVHDAGGHTAEVGERLAVARPERRQILLVVYRTNGSRECDNTM